MGDPNTISHVENARVTLSATTEAIEEALTHVMGLKWMPNNGRSIGLPLHYDSVHRSFDEAVKLRAFKNGRVVRADDLAFERGIITSDYPAEKLQREHDKREKKQGRDKRVRLKPPGDGGYEIR